MNLQAALLHSVCAASVAAVCVISAAQAQDSGLGAAPERVRAAQLKLGDELPEPRPEETAATALLVGAMVGQLKDQQSKGATMIPRDQHPKQHGCVRATLTVAENLPESLRVGLFRKPGTYHALIRFSNGASAQDNVPDVHGMAIKLLDVEGPSLIEGEADAGTQDLILTDHPVFFAIDPKDLVEFIGGRQALAQAEKAGDTAKADAVRTRFALEFGIFKVTKKLGSPSPLEMTFFSQTPYRLGTHAVKYIATPGETNKSGRPPVTGNSPTDTFQAAMIEHLTTTKKAATFQLGVVIQTDPVAMPVENPTVLWAGEPLPVATITILPQEFARQDQLKFGENLSFTPWHAREAHRPLGGINRARRPIYQATSSFRHDANMVPRHEPTLTAVDALFPVEAAAQSTQNR